MAKAESAEMQCPMEIGINILSGKWTLKVLWQLSKGTTRFNELQRELGMITTRTLTMQLRELEEQGIIVRKVYAEVPPRVEYSLSPVGKTLQPIMSHLCDWGKYYQQETLRKR